MFCNLKFKQIKLIACLSLMFNKQMNISRNIYVLFDKVDMHVLYLELKISCSTHYYNFLQKKKKKKTHYYKNNKFDLS